MTVADNFRVFRANYLIPTGTVSSISNRYKRITRQLNKDFWNTESETAHSLYVGSYGRDTAANGVSDLDVAFTLPNSIYHQYNAHAGNGQSAMLQAVRTSITRTYANSYVGGDGQVVALNFTDGIRFEILPVFLNENGVSFTFADSNGGGSWKVCDPRTEMSAFATRNAGTNGNLKAIGRHGPHLARQACSSIERNVARHHSLPIHRNLGTSRQVLHVSRLANARFHALSCKYR